MRNPIDVVREMLEERERIAPGVGPRIERALDKSYWAALLPGERICHDDPAGPLSVGGADDQPLDTQMSTEGWAEIDACVAPGLLSRAKNVVEGVRDAGWPPIFAFVYDVVWHLHRATPVRRLLRRRLGDDYRQLPYTWVFRVAATPGAAGWEPHIDGSRGADVITVWVALTDATLDNGCVYVLPRSRVPTELARGFRDLETATRPQLIALLHGARALPVSAGSALLWDSDTIHWGSHAEGAHGPRIAVAALYVRRSAADESVLFEPEGASPPWLHRIGGCAQSILRYGRDEPALRADLGFAEALVQRVRALDAAAVMPYP